MKKYAIKGWEDFDRTLLPEWMEPIVDEWPETIFDLVFDEGVRSDFRAHLFFSYKKMPPLDKRRVITSAMFECTADNQPLLDWAGPEDLKIKRAADLYLCGSLTAAKLKEFHAAAAERFKAAGQMGRPKHKLRKALWVATLPDDGDAVKTMLHQIRHLSTFWAITILVEIRKHFKDEKKY